MLKHLDIKVHGQVVGVNFRHHIRQLAEELGITGFARNEGDNTVFVEVEGEEQSLDQFVEACKTGSKYAKVEKIEVASGEIKNYSDFKRL